MILSQSPPLPSFISTNVNRCFSKFDHIRATIKTKNIDVFAATESWLTDEHSDSFLSVDDFNVFRDDRSDGRIGGGVITWVKSYLQPLHFSPSGPQFGTNSTWLIFPNLKLHFVCIYIPPSSVTRSSSDVLTFISQNIDDLLIQHPEFNVIITGDFNRLNINVLLHDFDLVNIVNVPTRHNALLDLVLVSNTISPLFQVEVGPPISTSDHRTILCRATNGLTPTSSKHCIVHDLRKSNVDAFITALDRINFSPMYHMESSIDDKCEYLMEALQNCMSQTIPVDHVLMTENDKPYITPVIKLLINSRWQAYRCGDFARYRHLSAKVKDMIKIEKLRWARRACRGSKHLWQVVNDVRGTKSSRSTEIQSVLNHFVSHEEAVESINSIFSASQVVRPVPVIFDNSSPGEWSPTISVESVFKQLTSVKCNKASGVDAIPAILYREAASIIAAPLAHIINMSIISRSFPKQWKLSIISPVPKTSPPNPNELRPISLLPIPSKICENLILQHGIQNQFYEAFGEFQFGGVKSSSTAAALICLHDRITFALDKTQTRGVAVLTYDYTKAFDQLGHDIIIKALQEKGFPLGFVQWVVNYLSDRFQSVKLHNCISSTRRVKSGIPQGSILGPYLFNTVIGSLKSSDPRNTIVKYIDDCTYAIPICSLTAIELATEHQNMLSWSTSIGLSLNLGKCKLLWIPKSVSVCPPVIPDVQTVTELRILGVIFSQDLNWNSHFDVISKSASRRLYALRILRSCCSFDVLKSVYYGLILSVMEYCSPLFVDLSARNRNLLQKLQRRAQRIICSDQHQFEVFPDLLYRRQTAAIHLLQNIRQNQSHPLHVMCPQISERSGRFLQPPSRTVRRHKSFFPATVSLINSHFYD